MIDRLRKRYFGQLLRLISLNMNNNLPKSIEISDSKSRSLPTTLIPGLPPGGADKLSCQ